jgi:hypothetical protein
MNLSQNRPRKSGTLRGIGTGSDFIEKHNCTRFQALQGGRDILDVAGKSGTRLLKALLIADVCPDLGEKPDLAAKCWHRHSALIHQDIKTNCLE